MRCKKCNAKLAEHDLWCVSCGAQSPIVKTELSAIKSLKNTRHNLKNKISELVPATGFCIILGIIPIAMLAWMFHNYIHTDGTLQLLLSMIVKCVLYSIFLPFIFLPFSVISSSSNYELKFKDLIHNLHAYFRYFIFGLLNALYFMFIYIICFGLPGFASDPILRLVWVVLVNYWFAVMLPAPVLMERLKVNPFKAIKLSYCHFHDLRWNIYLLVILLIILNFVSFFALIFPLLFSLPLSFFAIRDYVIKLEQYELLEYRI
ncbi:MAG: hypothetical protein LHW48_03105 [Candidatus Cloacimonetes bacterium]|nr:hypothetical protein [Candidatus Cloacimonadota bacterium]